MWLAVPWNESWDLGGEMPWTGSPARPLEVVLSREPLEYVLFDGALLDDRPADFVEALPLTYERFSFI